MRRAPRHASTRRCARRWASGFKKLKRRRRQVFGPDREPSPPEPGNRAWEALQGWLTTVSGREPAYPRYNRGLARGAPPPSIPRDKTPRSGSVRGSGSTHIRRVRARPPGGQPPDVLPSASGESAELTGEAASAALPPLRRRSPRPPARTPSVPSAGVESLPTPDGRNPVQTSRSEGRAPPAPETGRTGGRKAGAGRGGQFAGLVPQCTPMARLTKSGLGLPGTGHVGRPHLVARGRSCRGSGGIPQPEFL